MKKLLRAIRKQSAYAHGYLWEPGTDYADHPNKPFKPAYLDVGGIPNTTRADLWNGGLSTWDDALAQARVGHTIDFYVSKLGFGGVIEELETNVHVWLVSEKMAWVQDCGGKPYQVAL